MDKHAHAIEQLLSQRGVTALMVAAMMVVFLGLAALAVDIGFLLVARNQSQNAADAAALAGARRMGENYYNHLDPTVSVVSVAQDVAGQNAIAGRNPVAANVDTRIGTWDPPFTETSVSPNAVQATVTREGPGADGAISTSFAHIFGITTLNVGATAVAALSGPCEGKPSIPLGIGKGWFAIHPGTEACGPEIKLNATGTSCAGWTNLETDPFQIQKDVEDMFNGTLSMPEKVESGSEVQFIGGTITPILVAMEACFRNPAIDTANKTFDAAGNVLTWTTYVVVYDAPCGQNPNALYTILGFAHLKITDVIPTGPTKGVVAQVVCNITEEVRGGCFNAGTLGAIPGLVK